MVKSKPPARQQWLHRLLVFLIMMGLLTLMVQISSLLGRSGDQLTGSARLRRAISQRIPWRHRSNRSELQAVNELQPVTNELKEYEGEPTPVADTGDNEVSSEDLLHLSLLHERCVTDTDAVLPWQFGSPDHQSPTAAASNPEVVVHQNDSILLQTLKQCPDVDIYLPNHLHGNGYCEDAVAYAKYLNSRLLPLWALQVKMFDPELGRDVDYFDLCPKTPMIFFNHYWDDVPSMPRWPENKPIYLMPNIEMIELTPEFYWRVNAVLCKTQICFDRVTKWYEQEGNPRNAEVLYTKHTSSDQAQFARKRLGESAIAAKDFSNVTFLHTPGTSIWKGTRAVLDCWTSMAGLPPLDVYINESAYTYMMPPPFQTKLNHSRSPVNVHLGMVERSEFTKITAEAAFFMCPSRIVDSTWSGFRYLAAVMDKLSAEEPSRGRRSWALLLLVPLVGVGLFTLIVETTSLLGPPGDKLLGLHRAIGLTWRNRFSYFLSPDEAVADEDLLHLSLLHEVCITDTNASLPWQFGSPGNQAVGGTANNSQVLMHKNDKDLLQKLRQCPTVDVFLPHNVHTNGYCEDAVAFVKYLESRLLPGWILETKFFDPNLGREVDYFDLCPKTPVLFLDHHWGGVTASPRWPKEKPIYMVPNIEIVELTPMHYWGVDAVLCKTNECNDRVTKWYEQEGNPRNAKVFYTKHTSTDPGLFVRKRLGEYAVSDKDFSNIRVLHTAGTSAAKGTSEVLECWTYTSGLPPLDVYIDRKPFYRLFPASYKMKIARSLSPMSIHLGMMNRMNYSKVVADASFIINPSYSEGYGHIINQARASGAVIITSDVPPMNEMIIANESGILVSSKREKHPMVMLGGKYKGEHGLKGVGGLVASFQSSDVCEAVQRMMRSTTPGDRAEIGLNARREYHSDTKYFANAMQETPMIFFNHYWDGVPLMPRWPKDKPIYLMPNIEMFELTPAHYWKVDVVLCKTQECYDRVTRWYKQEGNPRNTPVFYTKHTSSDQALFARKRMGERVIRPKDFSDIKFIHTAGTSSAKGTRELLECWIFVPGLPQLDVYIDDKPFNLLFKEKLKMYLKFSRSPVNVHVGLVERSKFTKLTADTTFFMCPSVSEGYGHYINQARAAGAVVVTTDLSPMNELITANETGFLIPVERRKHSKMLMGGAYRGEHGLRDVDGLVATFRGPNVCEVVREMMALTTTEQRAAMGANARRAYHEDTEFFAKAMQELRQFARRSN
ncbi:hypothetical protein JG687_00007587 [Phytophthora cactorum]|uniref:Glycosyl transferase family 1 domain-containing protein n=1 Tax=Phytophthora cactorum TaxID=29920 RepID=A0A8T1UH22_9STRA|nr:hypothetical protein JG687_00007587 [Phytophthora cactorum]